MLSAHITKVLCCRVIKVDGRHVTPSARMGAQPLQHAMHDASGRTAEGNGDTARRTCHRLWGTVSEAVTGDDVKQNLPACPVLDDHHRPPSRANPGSSSPCSQPLYAHHCEDQPPATSPDKGLPPSVSFRTFASTPPPMSRHPPARALPVLPPLSATCVPCSPLSL